MLNIIDYDIVFQELPTEVSLALTIAGCPLRCHGCHRADTWRSDIGTSLTEDYLATLLAKYKNLISCVLFMGGEWEADALLLALKQVRAANLKTALYTGLEQIPMSLQTELTYLKTGPWIIQKGGLDNPNTNQKLIECRTGKTLNHLFWREHG